MNNESEKSYSRQIRREHEAERAAQKSKTRIPSEIYTSAILKGLKWAFIVFVALASARAIDGAIGINVLTPEDKTKRLDYYVPYGGAQVLTARREDDTTFVVDVPLGQICSRVNLEIPKGKWLYVLSITPIGVELPTARTRNGVPNRFKAGKYGGYLTMGDNGTPQYVMMHEMYRECGVPTPYGFYGSPLVMIDSVAYPAYQRVGLRASSRQPVYFGVNLYYDDGSAELARGFYRIRFVFASNKFAR